MIRSTLFNISILASLLLLSSCSEDDDLNPLLFGDYEGYYYHSSPEAKTLPVPLTLQFEKRNYTGLSQDSTSQSLFIGQFSVEGNKVSLMNGYNAIAESDWQRILSGTYTDEIIDQTIHMSREYDSGIEGFRLTKKGGL